MPKDFASYRRSLVNAAQFAVAVCLLTNPKTYVEQQTAKHPKSVELKE
jgi:hypothetical protein